MDKGYGIFPRLSRVVPIIIGRYGAFTYTINEKAKIINYVKNQKENHKAETSFDEYKRLIIENGIDPIAIGFDEKYLL